MIIDIISGASEDRAELAKIVSVNHAAYAARWNYGYERKVWRVSDVVTVPGIGCGLPWSWSKIPLLKQWLYNNVPCPEPRFVLWADDDLAFTRPETPLDDFIVGHAEKELIVSEDVNGPNFGCFILRNTFGSIGFLNDIWNLMAKHFQHCWFEQAAAHELLVRPDYPLHVGRLPWRTLQSSSDWMPGDFSRHTAGGGSIESRAAILKSSLEAA